MRKWKNELPILAQSVFRLFPSGAINFNCRQIVDSSIRAVGAGLAQRNPYACSVSSQSYAVLNLN